MQQYNVTKAFWILGKMLQTGEKPDIARFHRDKIQYKIHLTFSCASVRHIFVASRIILLYDTNPPMSLAFLAWPANCKNAQIVNFFSVVYLRCICLPEISSFYYSFLVFSFFLQWHIGGTCVATSFYVNIQIQKT